MPYNTIFTFEIRIVKTKNKFILIGVVDEPKQRNQRQSFNSNNAICYSGYTGNKYPEKVNEGNGYSQG